MANYDKWLDPEDTGEACEKCDCADDPKSSCECMCHLSDKELKDMADEEKGEK